MPKPRRVSLGPIEDEFLPGRRRGDFSDIDLSILCTGAGLPSDESFNERTARMADHFKKCDQEADTAAPPRSEDPK
jgi:hypothetical protein